MELTHRKEGRVFTVGQQHPRPLDPARRFRSRARNRNQLSQIIFSGRLFNHLPPCCHDLRARSTNQKPRVQGITSQLNPTQIIGFMETMNQVGRRHGHQRPRRRDAFGSILNHRRHTGHRSDDCQTPGSSECRSPCLPFVQTGRESISRPLHSLDLSRFLDQALLADGVRGHRSRSSRGISASSPIRLERAKNPEHSGGVISGRCAFAWRWAPWTSIPVQSKHGHRALFSISFSRPEKEWLSFLENTGPHSYKLRTWFTDELLTKYLGRIDRT